MVNNRSSNKTREEILAEDSNIHESILSHEKRQFECNVVPLMAVPTVLGFAIGYDQPLFSLLGWFITFSFWQLARKESITLNDLGAYRDVFLEPELPGRNWEHRHALVEEEFFERSLVSFHFDLLTDPILRLTTTFPLLSVASILTGIGLLIPNSKPSWNLWVKLGCLLIVFLIHSFMVVVLYRTGWPMRERIRRRKAYEALKEDEENKKKRSSDKGDN